MTDQSHLDERYFVDEHVYNCPFCNRRHVSYMVSQPVEFQWTTKKNCFVYIARCGSCDRRSIHLTFERIEVKFVITINREGFYRFSLPEGKNAGELLDSLFFFSVPTSFFLLDERVPRNLRELLTEAEGCMKSNFLTGASACARKIVYELAVKEGAIGKNYEDRLRSLKARHPEVPKEYFDTLLTIQEVTSTKVHENSHDGWESKHVRIILASLAEVLHELYVVPARRQARRKAVLNLKSELMGDVSGSSARDAIQ